MYRFVAVFILSIMITAFASLSAIASGPSSPEEAIVALKDGNERFVDGRSAHPNLDLSRIRDTSENGQHPFATIIGCSDSRVPLELALDQGIGDLFIIRVAGNVCSTDEIGSIEYGVDHLGTPLMVVMGHTHCGACTAVAQGAEVHGSIPALVAPIGDAVKAVKSTNHELEGDELVAAVVEENVWQSIEDLLMKSPDTLKHVNSGTTKVIGAIYDIETGEVRWLGEHPKQATIIAAAGGGNGHIASVDGHGDGHR
ncbi:carbonic anhydrase [bacterium]|nr:carbonic anhydrase [bacterium]